MLEFGVAVQPPGGVSVRLTPVTAEEPVFEKLSVAVNDEPESTTVGATSETGCLTTTTVDPVTPPTVTEIVATPGATALITPLLLTLATLELLLL